MRPRRHATITLTPGGHRHVARPPHDIGDEGAYPTSSYSQLLALLLLLLLYIII